MSRTHYDVLGVVPSAPDAVIKAAYRARIRETHPDAGGNQQDAQAINDAWSVLQDADSRARYDQTLSDHVPPAASPERDTGDTSGEPGSFPPKQTPASPVYSTFPRPQRWFKTKLAWIPAALLVVAAVGSGLVGVTAYPALLSIAALATYLVPHVRARQLAYIAVALAAAMIFAHGDITEALILTCVIPAASAAAAMGMFAIARRREVVQTDLHIGDTVITTAETHGFALSVVVDIQRLSDSSTVITYDDGEATWPLLTARANGHVELGDIVVAERGTVIAWANQRTVLRAQKALAKKQAASS